MTNQPKTYKITLDLTEINNLIYVLSFAISRRDESGASQTTINEYQAMIGRLDIIRVRLKTRSRIAELSQHEADGGKFQNARKESN